MKPATNVVSLHDFTSPVTSLVTALLVVVPGFEGSLTVKSPAAILMLELPYDGVI